MARWDCAALAVSLFWISSFILRAPLSTARQYRIANPPTARKALAFSLFLVIVLALTGTYFWLNDPVPRSKWIFLASLPLGIGLMIRSWVEKNMRAILVEMLGFAGICLIVPILYYFNSGADDSRPFLLYILFAGYFLLSLLYIKIRQGWLRRCKRNEQLGFKARIWEGKWILLFNLVFTYLVFTWPGAGLCWVAPFFALLRLFVGLTVGRMALPIMKLGLREMAHSILFLALVVGSLYLS